MGDLPIVARPRRFQIRLHQLCHLPSSGHFPFFLFASPLDDPHLLLLVGKDKVEAIIVLDEALSHLRHSTGLESV